MLMPRRQKLLSKADLEQKRAEEEKFAANEPVFADPRARL